MPLHKSQNISDFLWQCSSNCLHGGSVRSDGLSVNYPSIGRRAFLARGLVRVVKVRVFLSQLPDCRLP